MSSGFAEIQGTEMSPAEIDEFLRTQGVGVLALAVDNEAYAIPISFGYDGDHLYFVFLRPGESSKKETFTEETERANFLVYDVGSRYEWTSVIVAGTLEQVGHDGWSAVVDALEDNAWYPSLFSQTEPMQDIVGWSLRIEDRSGMKSSG